MASNEFLKTEQKNEHIQFTNFDMAHWFQTTFNLGEVKPTQVEPILPNDSANLSINDEIICQALENPSFSNFKLCHKSFYMPNCNLWKYWDQFITNKPSYTWTNSAIQDFIDNTKPYTPPYFTWNQILPIIAFARGYCGSLNIGMSITADSPSSSATSVPLIYRETSDFKYIAITDLQNSHRSITVNDDTTGSYRDILRLLMVPSTEVNNMTYDVTSLFDSNGFQLSNSKIDTDWNNFSNTGKLSLDYGVSTPLTSSQETWLKTAARPYLYFRPSIQKCQHFSIVKKEYKLGNNEIIDFNVLDINRDLYNNFVSCPYGDVVPVNPTYIPYKIDDFNLAADDHVVCLPLPTAFEAAQYNMSPLAYLWYLCNNALKLLDSFGIPVYVDRLTPRGSKSSNFDAMPFFAYSKIYHEYIADKQLQVNCPDWTEANGPICPDDQTDIPSTHYTNGWILHHPEIPYNVNTFQYDEKMIIRNVHMARHLLLGLGLNNMLFSSKLDPSTTQVYQRTNKQLSHTYMVYNGLLHLQFANFPPDYFTEALLDPLAGAKDIQIPTTITQLQEKSKLQDFLNQTAWTRNIKEWLQSQWSAISRYTTVTEPSLCGSSDVDINISQVLQTSETDTTPLGTRAGVGSGYGNGKLVDRQFGEYGWLITISYIVLDTHYVNRLDVRQRAKSSRFDYPIPQFANLGNEKILQSEVQYEYIIQNTFTPISGNNNFLLCSNAPLVPGFKADSGSTAVMRTGYPANGEVSYSESEPQSLSGIDLIDGTFGYIPRYSIFKHHMDEVHGDFLTTLKRWVPTREFKFNCLPNYCFISYELASETCDLLKNFVEMNTFGDDNFLVNQRNNLYIRRALPYIVKPNL